MMALFMLTSLAYIAPSKVGALPVYADEDTTENPKYTGDDTEEEKGEGEGDSNPDKVKSNILEADLGKVEFWEWNKLTKSNFTKYMDDGKYHASMLFYYDTDNNRDVSKWNSLAPLGFISTYDDKTHIQRGIYNENWTQYWDKVTNDKGTWDAWSSARFSYKCSNGTFWTGFAEMQSNMISIDEMGKKLNGTGYYYQDRFFTTGYGNFGVPYIKSRRSGDDIIGNTKSGGNWTQWCSEVSIYLQRESDRKGTTNPDKDLGYNSTDTFLECWKGMEGNQPGIVCWKGTSGGASTGGVKNQGKCFTFHPARGKEDSDFWVAKCMVGVDKEDIDYAKCDDNDQESDYRTLPTLGVTKTGYLVAYDAKVLNGYRRTVDVSNFNTGAAPHYVARDIFGPETTDTYAMFKWYVGTRHVYTSINDQTIPEGKLKPFTAGDYGGEGGTAETTEGIIIPKGNTLTIDGGTVSVACHIINNGKIEIKNGGTLIIKDGGCIAPFTADCEGIIDCNGGNIIVMEGGKLFGLNESDAKNSALKLTTGSNLVNYGKVALTSAQLDKGSKIENRKDGILVVGVCRSDPLVLFNTVEFTKTSVGNCKWTSGGYTTMQDLLDAKLIDYYTMTTSRGYSGYEGYGEGVMVNFSISGTAYKIFVSEANCAKYGYISGDMQQYASKYACASLLDSGIVKNRNVGILGINCTPTIYNEKTATFRHKYESAEFTKDYASGVTIITPEY